MAAIEIEGALENLLKTTGNESPEIYEMFIKKAELKLWQKNLEEAKKHFEMYGPALANCGVIKGKCWIFDRI